uniref:Uncharacterized protein n=1 Tax=uncultured Thiotrichaceae bacterium TaxID=298394 RepID=A0A6S6U4G1_9GAMM|nr:MAG: Unknown protein [uncultured Thiotrichaceae bacterium]
MSTKSILSAALLLALCSHVAAFDASIFQTLDDKSETTANAFLALPTVEANKLALKHVQLTGDEQTLYPWQVFLLTHLSRQTLTPEQWTLLQENTLIANLEGEDYEHSGQINKQLTQVGNKTEPLCFAQLKIAPMPAKEGNNGAQEKQATAQQETFDATQRACIPQLTAILDREDVFSWYMDSIENQKYINDTAELFKQNGLFSRVAFGMKQGANFDDFSSEQQQKIITAWLPYFFGEKDTFSFNPQSIAQILKSNDEDFSNKFVNAIDEKLSEQLPNEEALLNLLKGVLGIESKQSAELFWKLAWQKPELKGKLNIFKEALTENYRSDNTDESFPESLHKAARQLMKEGKDIRFADVYLFLIGESEGGVWNDEHIATIKLLNDIAPDLADDAETQGVLKNAYREAAAIEFFTEVKHLEKTKEWLDKAAAIEAEPISWFNHLTGETKEGQYQHADFKSIAALHKKQQLSQLSDWVEHKNKPQQPFTELPLDLYELFTGTTSQNRLWHNTENGHALILDTNGAIHYLDGYGIVQPKPEQLKVSRIAPGDYAGEASDSSSGGTPTLTSSMDEWIEYAVRYISGENNETPELSSRGILHFANNTQAAKERLLFTQLNNGELSSYPDYLEYARHDHEILVMADVDSEINQYLITLPDADTAIQWMQNLALKAPANTRTAKLWYKDSGSADEEEHGIMIREYVHSDEDEEDKLLTALHPQAGFDYSENGCTEFKAAELGKQPADFYQKELALYQQGYVLERIYHDESCVEHVAHAESAPKVIE